MNEVKDLSSAFIESLVGYWNRFVMLLPRLAFALLVLVIIFFLASFIKRLIVKRLSGGESDPLFVRFISKITKVAIIIVGLILFLHMVGLSGVAGGLLAGAGISAFVFGFAFKDIAENFLAGLILAFNRPFSLNDTISINEFFGQVTALNFRTTHVKTFDGKDVFIPNAIIIKQPLTNLTRDGELRMDFVVGIAFEDKVQDAIKTILQCMQNVEDLKKGKEPFAVVEELGVSTVNIRVYFWTNTYDYRRSVLEIKGDVITRVKEALAANGFSMPADIQELKLYDNKDPLHISISKPDGA